MISNWVCIWISVFAGGEITGKLSDYRLPLNYQWKKCHNISNHCLWCFMSDFSKRTVFYNIRNFAYICLYPYNLNSDQWPTHFQRSCVRVSVLFFVTSNPLFSKARVAKVTRSCCLRSLVFVEAKSSLHFDIHRRPQVFLKGCCYHETQTIWCNGWQQTMIRLHFVVVFV